jgi:Prokaryotic Cytochrome C oxidase subunit IV
MERLDITWVALIGLAIASIMVSWFLPRALSANAVLLALAAIKGRRVALDYLDLRATRGPWRGLVSAWVIAVVLSAWLASAAVALL